MRYHHRHKDLRVQHVHDARQPHLSFEHIVEGFSCLHSELADSNAVMEAAGPPF